MAAAGPRRSMEGGGERWGTEWERWLGGGPEMEEEEEEFGVVVRGGGTEGEVDGW